MAQILFKSSKEAYDWVEENLIQGDVRYTPWTEDKLILSQFFHEFGCIIEEQEIPNIAEPTDEELQEIDGPQEYHKYIAIKLLELDGVSKHNIKIEYPFFGRRVDVFANQGKSRILIECCSLDINKVIEYLEERNTELWVVTSGYGPWEKIFSTKEDCCRWYIIKRGSHWKESYKKYTEYKLKLLESATDKINALDRFSQRNQ